MWGFLVPVPPDTADESVNRGTFTSQSPTWTHSLLYRWTSSPVLEGQHPYLHLGWLSLYKALTHLQRSSGGCPSELSCVHAQKGAFRSQEKNQLTGLEGTVPRAHIGPLESLLPSARIENLVIHKVLGRSSCVLFAFSPFFHRLESGERWSRQFRHPVIRWRNMSRMAGLPHQPSTTHFWFQKRIVSSIAGLLNG